MKICYISSARIPTDWAHVLQILHMCEAFADEGHAVTLLCPSWIDPTVGSDAYAYAGVKNNFQIVRLKRIDPLPGSTARFLYWVRTISFILSARIYVFFHHFDLLFTRDYTALFFFRKNCIFEMHGQPSERTASARLFKNLRVLVAVSLGIKQFYEKRNLCANRILLAPNAIEPSSFELTDDKKTIRRELNIPDNAYVVGYVGTLRAMGMEKGILTVIDAMKYANDGSLAYIAGGESSEIVEYETRAREAGVSERIIFAGRLRHEQVARTMRAFDCAVVPILDFEFYRLYTSPLKIFEYMAANVPIIASDLPSVRSVLDESMAIFVHPGDGRALAKAINDLRSNPVSSALLAAKALAIVRVRYTWRARAKMIIDFTLAPQR